MRDVGGPPVVDVEQTRPSQSRIVQMRSTSMTSVGGGIGSVGGIGGGNGGRGSGGKDTGGFFQSDAMLLCATMEADYTFFCTFLRQLMETQVVLEYIAFNQGYLDGWE